MGKSTKLEVGDWVEVLSKEEILRTLDSKGQLDAMPFMPEMFKYCGQKFRVFKRAHKTCDPDFRSRRIYDSVHLETRCDGSAHGGCQAGCLLFWKEAWLKPASDGSDRDLTKIRALKETANSSSLRVGATESDVWKGTKASVEESHDGGPTYVCQTTQVQYEEPLPWWHISQYIEDYSSGNISFWRLFTGFIYSSYYNLSQAGIGIGPAMRWFYNLACPLWRGSKWPKTVGTIPEGQPTPTISLNLQPGELVRVKSHEEILRTINVGSRNRGLWWDAELVPYCGKTFRVAKRVHDLLDEKTGKMLHMKNPSIILDSVVCQSRYTACRMFCPRNTYAYWREIWLERVEPVGVHGQSDRDSDSELAEANPVLYK